MQKNYVHIILRKCYMREIRKAAEGLESIQIVFGNSLNGLPDEINTLLKRLRTRGNSESFRAANRITQQLRKLVK